MVGAAVRHLDDRLDHLAVVDRILDPVTRRGRLALVVELDIDEEPLSVAALVLEHAVVGEELDRPELDRHPRTVPRSTAAAAASASTCERTSWTRNSVAPRSNAATAAPTDAASVPTRVSGPSSTRASVDLRDSPRSTGRPIATIRSSLRTSSRFWSGVLPKPIPGSRHTRSSGMPAATAKARRSSRKAATSETTST